MFDHVTIRASDRTASERFYETVLRTIGIEPTHSGEDYAEWDDFSLSQATPGKPVTRRLHVAFAAPSRELVDEFWRVGDRGRLPRRRRAGRETRLPLRLPTGARAGPS